MKNLFRGKRATNGNWIEGQIYLADGGAWITDSKNINLNTHTNIAWFEVDPDTVGRCTGFFVVKGKTHLIGKKIFEGDIIRSTGDNGDEYSVVMWLPQRAAFYAVPVAHYEVMRDNDVSKEPDFSWLFDDAALYDFFIDCGLSVIGNVHDNPGLLNNPFTLEFRK